MNLRKLNLNACPLARSILKEVSTITSFSCVAGGYLRDQYYGVPQKDIDIFVSSDFDKKKLTNQILTEWTLTEDVDSQSEITYDLKDVDFSVLNLSHPTNLPLQIVISEDFKNVQSVLESFNFGFCQVVFDGSNMLITDEFWQDAANDTITYLLKTKPSAASKTHARRLTVKYPNLKWVWNNNEDVLN